MCLPFMALEGDMSLDSFWLTFFFFLLQHDYTDQTGLVMIEF